MTFNKNLTRIYLVDSHVNYVLSDKDYADSGGTAFVKKGDPYVLVNFTISNDYDKGYHFRLYGHIYNESGEDVGGLLDKRYAGFSFLWRYLENNSISSCQLRFKYNKTDVASYDIIVGTDPVLDSGP